MNEITIKVADMKCDGCEATIRKALLKLDGVFDARANHKSGEVWLQVNESDFRVSAADAAIRGLDYEPEGG